MSNCGIFATSEPCRANTVLLKNLPRWRADNIRPYERYEIFAARNEITWAKMYHCAAYRPECADMTAAAVWAAWGWLVHSICHRGTVWDRVCTRS